MKELHNPDFRHAHVAVAPELPETPKLGLVGFHKPALQLSAYLTEPTTPLPAAVQRPHDGFAWGMLANDRYGDCQEAAILHAIEDFALDTGRIPPSFSDQDAVDLYAAITGWNPESGGEGPGTMPDAAMKFWQDSGFQGHKIVASVGINPANLDEMRVGIYEFVDVQLGVALPLTAQGQTSWQVVGNPRSDWRASPGSWGGHAIPAREYDPTGFRVVTWGQELTASNDFMQVYGMSAFIVITQEMLNNSGTSPTGLVWDDLVSDIKKL